MISTSDKKLTALYALKWNPFSPAVPPEALFQRKTVAGFLWRVENLVMDGGIAAVTGDPGLGKSVAMRLCEERLKGLRDVTVARVDRPQSGLGDFYRELGECFGVDFRFANRYGGFKALRTRWKAHIEQTLLRPCLLIDEAQEMPDAVLSELRLLVSEHFDSRRILAVVLAGDQRLAARLREVELLPLQSRLRMHLTLGLSGEAELTEMLEHALESAGNRQLMTKGVIEAVVSSSGGNPRTMMQTCDELLAHAMAADRPHIDEKLFFDICQAPQPKAGKARRA